MAFDPAPSTYFAGWAEDGANITLPLASITELSDVEADGLTGDIRKVMWSILEEFYQVWKDLVTADKPEKMTLSVSSSINSATNQITKNYTFSFVLDAASLEVVAEA